ncbi:MAG TPA: hypothetical protein PKV72_04815, partial [Candidatus Peribacteria bacterium]|nr:hypothetical protein [Candidatus Peribacteria bacterium]
GAVIGRIADAVKTVRHHEQILLSKQSRLAQLSISDRKKKIRRIRLLRAGNTPSKMNQASQMATGLAEQDANERWRERNAKAWKQRRRLQERAETNGEAATDEPVEAADDMVELKPHDRELFGGLDRVPADQRIIW